MMIIDIRKLNVQKKYSGELVFEYDADEKLINIPFVKFSSPVKVRADYELFEDDSLELRGEISFELSGQCSRCLKETSMNVKGELDAYFEPRKDAEDYSYSGGKIDLTEALEDAVMACMPFLLLCDENCEGIRYSNENQPKN
ncbi:MAG: DUF177 domain-containing protein [Clostridiales bacterium]|nr:DUF177 domain-containing protein [Clostridiales bacterium]